MADIAASDVTVTVIEERRVQKDRRNLVSIAFGDGALTYPLGGVPMPAFGQFAMRRNLSHLIFSDAASGNGYVPKWDYTNNKIKLFESGTASAPLDEADATDTPAAMTFYAEAVGW